MDPMEYQNLIESHAQMARAILNTLLASMESDSPPVDAVIRDTVWAAVELLAEPTT